MKKKREKNVLAANFCHENPFCVFGNAHSLAVLLRCQENMTSITLAHKNSTKMALHCALSEETFTQKNKKNKDGNARIKIKLLFYCFRVYLVWLLLLLICSQFFILWIRYCIKTSLEAITNKKLAKCKIFPFRRFFARNKTSIFVSVRTRCINALIVTFSDVTALALFLFLFWF